MRTPPGPWHRIEGKTPDADRLLCCMKMAILTDPDLIGEPLVFSGDAIVAMSPNDKAVRPDTNFTQTFLF